MTEIPEPTTACACFACTHPNADNAYVRALHTERHAGFREYLAERTDTSDVPKPSYRSMLLRVGQEYSVPKGACHDPRCYGVQPHPVHLL